MKNAKGFDNIRKIFFLFTTIEIGQTSKQKQKIFAAHGKQPNGATVIEMFIGGMW